jgi:NADH-quinone oxidoreductase subunit M
MINHGLSTGALFLIVGMIYERYHTRMMDDLGGLATRLPMITISMVFISMSSIGLPGLNGFVGEFLSLAGMFKANPIYAALGTSGVVLGAWYLLTAVQKVFFGTLNEPHHGHGDDDVEDMNAREFVSLAPLVVLCLWIGVRPAVLVDIIEPDIQAVVKVIDQARSDAAVTEAIAVTQNSEEGLLTVSAVAQP